LLITSGLAGIVVAAQIHRQRHFRRDMARLARRLKLHYTPEDRLDLPARFVELPLMRRGHNRATDHVITGAAPSGSITCFRLAYEIGSGGSREVRQWMLAVLETDDDLPSRVFLPTGDRKEVIGAWSDVLPEDSAEVPLNGPVRAWKRRDDKAPVAPWSAERTLVELVSPVLENLPAPIGLMVQGSLIAACSPTAGSAQAAEAAIDVVMRFARQVRRYLDSDVPAADAVLTDGAACDIRQ